MLDLKEVLYGIARAIVDNPDEVTVIQSEDDDNVTLTLSVAPDDMGLVIGRHGRIAKAIRTVMKAAAGTVSKKVNVEIR
ncbi:MAG: KH domain-containing protein [Ruminococcaceae bacterium]|nr:KH domain-containing protein [Oscillospiraceae bacterium]